MHPVTLARRRSSHGFDTEYLKGTCRMAPEWCGKPNEYYTVRLRRVIGLTSPKHYATGHRSSARRFDGGCGNLVTLSCWLRQPLDVALRAASSPTRVRYLYHLAAYAAEGSATSSTLNYTNNVVGSVK